MVLVDAAGNDIVQARKNIEDWFDSSMDRVSGWYKRRTQIITLLLGILIAAVINVDTLSIANSLYTTASMRDSLVAAAQEYAVVNPAPAENSGQTQGSSPEERISQNLEELRNLNIPIGWNSEDPHSIPTTSGGWVTKVLGCIITGFAISLGAPFWFDLLNKFVVIRSTVRPKEKSPEEPPVNK
jgi:hypothetical protein